MIVAHYVPAARRPERDSWSIRPQPKAYGAVNEFPQIEAFRHRGGARRATEMCCFRRGLRYTYCTLFILSTHPTPPYSLVSLSRNMASDPYSVYNRPAANYSDNNEPVYNPYAFTSGHDDDYRDNHYAGYRDDAFVPPRENPPISEKHTSGPSRAISSTRAPRECVMWDLFGMCCALTVCVTTVSQQIEWCGALMETIRTWEPMEQGGSSNFTPFCHRIDITSRGPEPTVSAASSVAP